MLLLAQVGGSSFAKRPAISDTMSLASASASIRPANSLMRMAACLCCSYVSTVATGPFEAVIVASLFLAGCWAKQNGEQIRSGAEMKPHRVIAINLRKYN